MRHSAAFFAALMRAGRALLARAAALAAGAVKIAESQDIFHANPEIRHAQCPFSAGGLEG
jgi:hypothetical protein